MAPPVTPPSIGRFELLTELAPSHLGPMCVLRPRSDDGASDPCLARRVQPGVSEGPVLDLITEAAWTAMEVSHPLLPPVLEVLAQGSEVTVVYGYGEAVPLRALLRASAARRRPLAPDGAVRLVRDLAEALSALHAQAGGLGEAGLGAFGGFTPDSVLVGTDGRARLMDALVSGAANRATAVRAHADRIAYTAPELLADVAAGANDPRGDVFALGVLLWELLAKRRLFTGSGRDLEQQVRSLEVPRLDSLGGHERARISPALVEVVAQALERDPRARPQDMAELIAAVVATGADCARSEAVGAYVEEVARSDLERQRHAIHPPPPAAERSPRPGLARAALSATAPRPLPGVVRAPPEGVARPGAGGVSEPRAAREPPPPPPRAVQLEARAGRRQLPPLRRSTLLGMAPPKPEPRAEAVSTAREAERPAAPVPTAPEPARLAAPAPLPAAGEEERAVTPEPGLAAREEERPVTPEAVPAAREEARVGTPVTPRPEMGQEATDRSAADAPLRAMAVSAVPLVHDHRLDEVLASRHRPRLPPALLVIGGAAVFLVGALSIAAVLVRRPAALPAAGSAVAAAAARPGAPLAPSLTASTGAPLAPSLTTSTGAPPAPSLTASVEPSPAVALSASGRLPAPVDVAPLAAAPEEPRPPTVSPPPAARSRAPSSPTVPARSAPDATRRPAKTTYVPDGI